MAACYNRRHNYLFIYLHNMKTTILSLICLCLVGYSSQAQTFLGLYGTENCVAQIRDNPAFAVHEDRAQINFLTVGGEIGGNALFFKKGIYNSFFTGIAEMDKDYYRSYDKHSKSMWGNMEVIGPGASVLVKKKYFFAIGTGMRYMMNMNNLDNNVFRILGVNGFRTDTLQLDSFRVKNFAMTAQVYSELNLTYAGYLYQDEDYALIGGATVKVLNGIGAAGVGIGEGYFKTYNNDGLAHNTTADINVAYTPFADRWAITNSPLRSLKAASNNLGVGVDLGVVYYMNPNETMFRKKGYTNRLAVSITDIGSINYSAGSMSGKYAVTNKTIDFRNTQNGDGSFGTRLFNEYMADSNTQAKGEYKKVKFGLPTALHINGDFKVQRNIYVNGNILINLRKPDAYKLSTHYITTFTVTPRIMGKVFGVAMPFSFNWERQGYLGLIGYAGPVYVGCGSLFQMTVTNSINNLNLFAGCALRIKQKKPKERDYMMM